MWHGKNYMEVWHRQKFSQLCRAVSCLGVKDTHPIYEGDGMYSLCCIQCGDSLSENVDADKLFTNGEDMFNNPGYHQFDYAVPVCSITGEKVGRRGTKKAAE